MCQAVDREGTFRATITEYGLQRADSGAVGVIIKATLTEMWDGGEQVWIPWAEYDQECVGTLWVIKKDGHINEGPVKSLCQFANWDGDFDSINAKTWQATPCQVTVEPDEYKGVVRYRIGFVNDFNRVPGGIGTLDDSAVKDLKARFGTPLRALASTVKANSKPAPNGKPPAPPAAKATKPKADPAPVRETVAAGPPPDDEVPF